MRAVASGLPLQLRANVFTGSAHMIREHHEDNLTTADLANAGKPPRREAPGDEEKSATHAATRGAQPRPAEELAPLFVPAAAADFRAEWDAIQIGFVDDPRKAVRRGDELVARVMKSLAESFSQERVALEKQLGAGAEASTENLRVALRRYRSFFERLLSL
jgi:hypothetical protein